MRFFPHPQARVLAHTRERSFVQMRGGTAVLHQGAFVAKIPTHGMLLTRHAVYRPMGPPLCKAPRAL